MATKNIYIIGPMGAGKTSIGRALARELKLTFYDSDQVVEERSGADLLWIYDIEGEEGFRQREIKVIAELVNLPGILLATGGGTVASVENRSALTKNGVIIYLKASLDEQLKRTSFSKRRPLSRSPDARRDKLSDLHTELEPLYQELADVIFETQNKSLTQIIRELKKLI